MDGDTLQSPGRTSKRLIEYSAKRSTNHLGYDLNDEQSIFSQSPRQTVNLNDMEPFSSERISLDKTPSKSTLKPERKKIEKILSKENVQEEDSFDIEMDIFRFEINGEQRPDEKSFTQDSRIEALSPSPLIKENSRTEKKALSRLDIVRRDQSLKMDRLSSLRSNYSSKKSGAGSFLSEAEPASQSFGASKMLNASGKASLVNFVAMARRMGLLRRVYAYEDYMSVEQFNMIKDLSTGRFDSKEEKRTEQMARLKSKLMVEFRRNRASRRKTHLIDWKESLLPSLKRMYRKMKETVSRVILPNGIPRTSWDIFLMLLIFYDVIMVPLTIAFDVPLPNWLEIWDIIMTTCYILDIFLNFNTGFYDKGLLVLDRHRIFVHYIKSWFILDMVASFPYEYAIHNEATQAVIDNSSYQVLGVVKFLRFIRVFRFIRIFKLKGIFIKMESFLDMSNLLTSVIGFLKLSFIILFIAHWFACIWHFVALLELDSKPETWLTKNDLIDASWEDRYIASIYWATTTMITVGYGDIVPTTVNEQLVAIFAMLVASAVFAYTMNRINLILTGLENTSEQYQKASSTITEYMRKKHVKKELQIKIKKYLEYALEVETSLDSNEAYLSAYLNQSLKNELITEIHSKSLLENLIFRRFDSSLIMKTSLIMKEKIYSPEDPVFFENESEDPSIYIIHSGKIEIFNFRANAFLRSLTRGQYFGEISFFTGQARSASARSTDFSALYYVRRNEFLDIMDEFPVEKEKFHELKDKVSIYEHQQVLGMRCYSCESPDHLVKNCPKVHLVIPKTLFIESYINQRTKFMGNYIRLGARGSRQIYTYSKMAVAARKIQVKIWEGDLVLDKGLSRLISVDAESPEYSQPIEHPSILFARNKNKIVTGSPRLGEVKLTRKSVSVEPRKDNISIDIEVHVAESAVNDLANLSRKLGLQKKSVSIVSNSKLYAPSKPSLKKSKKHTFFDDIDRVHNFVQYFPHNNFEIQFPPLERRRKTAYFDYFSHADTTKATLKRFVAILRERVRARKELELNSPDRSSANSRFTEQTSPTRSRFFPGSPQPSKNDVEESRNDPDNSRSFENTS